MEVNHLFVADAKYMYVIVECLLNVYMYISVYLYLFLALPLSASICLPTSVLYML